MLIGQQQNGIFRGSCVYLEGIYKEFMENRNLDVLAFFLNAQTLGGETFFSLVAKMIFFHVGITIKLCKQRFLI